MSSKVVSESRAGAAVLILNAAEMFCVFKSTRQYCFNRYLYSYTRPLCDKVNISQDLNIHEVQQSLGLRR